MGFKMSILAFLKLQDEAASEQKKGNRGTLTQKELNDRLFIYCFSTKMNPAWISIQLATTSDYELSERYSMKGKWMEGKEEEHELFFYRIFRMVFPSHSLLHSKTSTDYTTDSTLSVCQILEIFRKQ